jgi:hypothetical protein
MRTIDLGFFKPGAKATIITQKERNPRQASATTSFQASIVRSDSTGIKGPEQAEKFRAGLGTPCPECMPT